MVGLRLTGPVDVEVLEFVLFVIAMAGIEPDGAGAASLLAITGGLGLVDEK